jgi:hypothetical protein
VEAFKNFKAITTARISVLLITLFISLGCVMENGKISVKFIPATVLKVSVANNQLIINGSNLSGVTTVQVKGDSLSETLSIESKSGTQIVANGIHSINFGVDALYNLVLSNAEASATFPVTFTMSNNSITAAMLTSMGATTGQIMKYNGTAWVPSNLAASQTYLGTWNASTNNPDISIGGYTTGDYYIVSVAGTYSGNTYAIGDWAMYNGSTFDRINNSANAITKTTVQPVSKLRVYGSNANNYVEISAPTLSGNLNFIFPSAVGNSGDVLTTDGAGNLSWTTPSVGGGSVTSVNTKTGAVVLSTSDISEGTNLYYTDARVRSAALTGYSVGSNTALAATDTTLGAFQKLQGQINAKEGSITAGTTAQYLRGDKSLSTFASDVLATVLTGFSNATSTAIAATDTILAALGKTQGQLNNKADKTNVTQTITAATITGLTAPVAGSDAANKDYVDGFGQWTKSGSDVYRSSGNVGIGTSGAPAAKLEVAGGQAIAAVYDAGTSAAIDFNNGNVQTSSAAAGTITFTNIKSGGSYTLVLTNATGGTYTMSSGSFAFKCQPDCSSSQIIVTAGKHTVVTIIGVGTTAYVAWMRGF